MNQNSFSFNDPVMLTCFSCSLNLFVDCSVKRQQAEGPAADKAARPITACFHALTLSDQPLVEALADFNSKDPKHLERLTQAAARSSHGARSPAQQIGALMWACQYKAVPAARFVMYLKTAYDKDLLTEEAVRTWHSGAVEEVLGAVPQGVVAVGAAELQAMRAGAKPFMDWLDAEEEEDDEEGSGEEEED